MSTRAKSMTWTRVDILHHNEPNQLIYDQFTICDFIWEVTFKNAHVNHSVLGIRFAPRYLNWFSFIYYRNCYILGAWTLYIHVIS